MTDGASDFTVRLAVRVACHLVSPATKATLAVALDVSPTALQRAFAWLREAGAPLTYDHDIGAWVLRPGWHVPGKHIDHAELIRAWADREALRRILEVEDVVAEVERLVASEVWPGREQPERAAVGAA